MEKTLLTSPNANFHAQSLGVELEVAIALDLKDITQKQAIANKEKIRSTVWLPNRVFLTGDDVATKTIRKHLPRNKVNSLNSKYVSTSLSCPPLGVTFSGPIVSVFRGLSRSAGW